MKAIIVDDEYKSREVLKTLLLEYPDVEIVAEAESVESALETINRNKPDILFLDISLASKLGFEILDKLDTSDLEVIFVTSYAAHAIKAIKYKAFDYLLKPIDLDELDNCVKKLRHRFINSYNGIDKGKVTSISVHVGSSVRIIPLSDILYFEADGAYSTIYTMKESFSTSKNLKCLESLFKSAGTLIRVNRNLLVNGQHIVSYTKGLEFNLTLSNNRVLEVSRRKKGEVLKLYTSWKK